MNSPLSIQSRQTEQRLQPGQPQRHLSVLLALSRYDHRTHKGVAEFAAKHNWHLNCEMAITGKPPRNWRGDGILALLSEDQDIVDFVLNTRTPFVDISMIREDIPAPRVSADNRSIGRQAAQYYIDKGFRHFAFFSTSDERVTTLRRESFFETAQRRALSLSDWSINTQAQQTQTLTESLIQHIHSTPQPLALFAVRDIDASVALDACLQAGVSVPDQIAILGVDNNDLITKSLQVPLSSVNHNVEALGYKGAELLHKIMCHPEDIRNLTKETQLVRPSGISSRLSTDCLAVNNHVVRTALNELNVNFTNNNYSVCQAAEACKMSRRHLDNLFKLELGHSIHTELIKIRLRTAQQALLTTNDSVASISEYCGFTRVQYFNKCFREHTGLTPLAFRKRNK